MRAIILAGGPADRPSDAPEGLPRPLWPLVLRPLMYRLIDQLMATGVDALSVCANGQTTLYALRLESEHFKLDHLHFTQDPLPRGPAGCVKDNESVLQNDEPFLVVGAASWLTDSAESLIDYHRQQGNKLTIFCFPNTQTPSGVYVFDPDVLEHIPQVGYYDIKEQLIPRLVDHGLRVTALPLRQPAAEVVSVRTYLQLHHRVLCSMLERDMAEKSSLFEEIGPNQWKARSAYVDPKARLVGPILIGPNATIGKRAVIIGPVTIGPDATIGEDAIVTESVVWQASCLAPGRSAVRTMVVDHGPSKLSNKLRPSRRQEYWASQIHV